MKTRSHKPVYDNPMLRIASMPNGLWQLQRNTGDRGRNSSKTCFHFDPWQAQARPCPFEVALDQLNSAGKARK